MKKNAFVIVSVLVLSIFLLGAGDKPKEPDNEVNRLIAKSLSIILSKQRKDGLFEGGQKVELTAKAGLALLFSRDEKYVEPVYKAALKLLRHTSPRGYISSVGSRMPEHCFAMIFLFEVYRAVQAGYFDKHLMEHWMCEDDRHNCGRGRVKKFEMEIKRALQRAVGFVEQVVDGIGKVGGWELAINRPDVFEMSSYGYILLEAKKLKFKVNEKMIKKLVVEIKKAANDDGGFKYVPGDQKRPSCIFVTGGAVYVLSNANAMNENEINKSLSFILRSKIEKRSWYDLFGHHFFTTLVMKQAPDEFFKKWKKLITEEVLTGFKPKDSMLAGCNYLYLPEPVIILQMLNKQ